MDTYEWVVLCLAHTLYTQSPRPNMQNLGLRLKVLLTKEIPLRKMGHLQNKAWQSIIISNNYILGIMSRKKGSHGICV
jgi:hypothetical protein